MVDILYKMTVKNCDIVFKEGLEPGVLGIQVVTFKKDKKDPMLYPSIEFYKDEFINSLVDVEVFEDEDEE